MSATNCPAGRRAGFTLVEMLVAISILAIAAGLTLQGVVALRESARRAQCGNHLKQLGLALQLYADAYQVYPAVDGSVSVYFKRDYSAFSRLLPYVDQSPLADAINFDFPMGDFYLERHANLPLEANKTAMRVTLDVLLCPSDGGGGDPGWAGNVNYRTNLGVTGGYRPSRAEAGPFAAYEIIDGSQIADGLSHTAAISEKLRGSVRSERYEPNRAALYPQALHGGLEETLLGCRFQDSANPRHHDPVGLSWFVGSLAHTCYNHMVSPNSKLPDCILLSTEPLSGMMPARSLHPGGVSCGFLDGSVRFMTSTVSSRTWRALGTRSGGEIVEAER